MERIRNKIMPLVLAAALTGSGCGPLGQLMQIVDKPLPGVARQPGTSCYAIGGELDEDVRTANLYRETARDLDCINNPSRKPCVDATEERVRAVEAAHRNGCYNPPRVADLD